MEEAYSEGVIPVTFFKLPGKIVNRCVAKLLGNLREIHFICADELLGCIDFHKRKIFNDTKLLCSRKIFCSCERPIRFSRQICSMVTWLPDEPPDSPPHD